MMIYADTADLAEIRDLAELGLIDGVTTNPTLVARSGAPFRDTIAEICRAVTGPVSAEVVANTVEAMVAEGRALAALAQNVVVKLPLTLDGLRACRALRAEGIATNVTLCFSLGQAVLAAKAGASFISPFIGRLEDIGEDGLGLISDIRRGYDLYGFETKVLAASTRSVDHIVQCIKCGADAVTAPPKAIHALVEHRLTDAGLKQFEEDARQAGLTVL